jgi:FKBP-type peptidyl-prolyl cis-trans isomerase SlpA
VGHAEVFRGFYNGAQIIESFMALTLACVESGSFLTLHYRLGGPAGDIINTFGGKPATLSLGTGELSPAVEQRLLGLEEGARATFELPAGAAFGERKADMVQWVARKLLVQLGDPLEIYRVGDVVQFPTPDGQGTYAGAVVQVGGSDKANGSAEARASGNDNLASGGDAVLFDFNHPLAGQPVTFEVHVIGVL